jgi:1-acyl-sn-glycerol-3-phosphate acyltransferase
MPDVPAIAPVHSRILYFLSMALSRLFFRLEFSGVENLSTSGAALLLCKHQSYLDVPLGYYLLKKHVRRDVWCIIKDTLAKPWLLGLISKSGGIPIDRANPEKSKDSLKFARRTLQRGELLIIFPEQTRKYGVMGRGKSGGFRFIAGKPARPLTVHSVGYEYFPVRFGRTRVVIRIGPARPYSRQDDPDSFVHERMLEIAALSGLHYRYPAPLTSVAQIPS